MKKKALITGVNGQDGHYLKNFLLQKDYKIIGLSTTLQDYEIEDVRIVHGDITDEKLIKRVIYSCQPDEVYNLASQSFPGKSWTKEFETMMTNAMGAQIIFNAVREINPQIKIYQASSSEMFGRVNCKINESTPLNPLNPYAAAKCYAHQMAKIYRKSYGLFICSGILFNHESPLRGMHFITQKITYAAACLKLGISNSSLLNEKGKPIVENGKLALGNLEVERDWGFAGDYVEAMWLMLQQTYSDDYVIATGVIKSLKELCEIAFSSVGLDWKKYVIQDKSLIRPVEVDTVISDPGKAEKILGWKAKTSFESLIKMMISAHLEKLATRNAANVT